MMVKTRNNDKEKGFRAKLQSADEPRNKVREFIGSINTETLRKIIGNFCHRISRAAFTNEIHVDCRVGWVENHFIWKSQNG